MQIARPRPYNPTEFVGHCAFTPIETNDEWVEEVITQQHFNVGYNRAIADAIRALNKVGIYAEEILNPLKKKP